MKRVRTDFLWQCNHKFKNKTKCSTPYLTEEQLKEAFVNMFNSTVANRDELTEGILDIISEISNTDNIDAKLSILYKELEASAEQIRLWVEENAHRAMSQIKYEAEYAKRTEVYKRVNEKISELEKEKLIKKNKYKEAKTALSILKENNTPIQEFDSGLFFGLIENVVSKSNCILLFNFKDGSKVEYELQKGLKIRRVKNIKRG